MSTIAFTQKGTQSPYSVFGMGELRSGKYAYFNSLGGTQIANTDSTIITQSNPASYAGIDRNRPIFQIGINGSFNTFKTSTTSSKTNQMGLDQFQLGLPIAKNWGASLGLTPFSSTGYLFSNAIIENNDTLAHKINEGKGTFSNFHIGLAYKQKIRKNKSLSFGLNANYLFGDSEKIESFEYVSYPNDALHTRIKRSNFIGGIKFDIGLIYEQQLYRGSFTIASTFSAASKLKSSSEEVAFAYSKSFYENYSYLTQIADTSKFLIDVSGETFIPESFKIGGEYRIKPCPGSNLKYLLIFKGEYNHQNWSNYKTTFGTQVNDSIYADRSAYKLGIEYTPYAHVRANNNLVSYFAKVKYRFGLNYILSEIMVNDNQLKNYGISFGLGIPVLNGNSNTNLNLGVTYSNFGTTENNLIQEQKIGLSFGVSISPGSYDRWFMKRKYD